ncbi:uncharacterized protein LOC100212726 [Hydra vulgaris]|uniref:uncharacterized protein LOC100212726 n=1 Tax=Hydra vulgaris TaxID=6087 RepID=UPI000640C0D2|nr:uncharacterized protein LOC100212726 [Hydra vulgaris]XP_047125482.1 uncharacterized protein LOC100212726 [Hydra vulgaris]
MVQTVIATQNDIDNILRCTNDAFMADAFFKKPEYHHRFTRENVISKMSHKDSVFILARDGMASENSNNEVIGSIYLNWITKTEWVVVDNSSIPKVTLIGTFSAVSVPSKYGKRGIGKTLVASAENYLLENVFKVIQHQMSSSVNIINNNNPQFDVVMEIEVVNLRVDLFPWYEKQGYQIVDKIKPNDVEFTVKILDGMDVFFILMRKKLL